MWNPSIPQPVRYGARMWKCNALVSIVKPPPPPPPKPALCLGPALKAALITGTERRSGWQASSILLKCNERNLCRLCLAVSQATQSTGSDLLQFSLSLSAHCSPHSLFYSACFTLLILSLEHCVILRVLSSMSFRLPWYILFLINVSGAVAGQVKNRRMVGLLVKAHSKL